jgi:hypothetical protein
MPPRRPQNTASGSSWWLIAIVAIAIAAGLFYWWQRSGGPSPEFAGGPASTAQSGGPYAPADGPEKDAAKPADESKPPEEEKPADGPKHPLPAGVTKEGDPSLPELAKSDAPILESLTGIAPRTDLGRFGNIGDFTRRVVITVDNLPRERVPAQYSVVQRIPGALAVGKEGEAIVLKPENYRRYSAFVGFAESVGAKQLAQVYLRYYPLFQQEYRAMGYPKGHFHDRVIEAIDDMLSAPTPAEPIRLVQPKVYYVFEDPALESLSAGRKIMIRVGPENAARLKRLLRAIRAELTR